MRLLRQPLLHFVLIGLLIFGYQQYQESVRAHEIAALDAETRQRLHDDFVRQTGRLPSPSQLNALEAQELESRILFSEALRRNFHRDDSVVLQRLLRDANFLGLEGSDEEKIRAALELGVHESDEVIRRRMIQRMERLGRAQAQEAPTHAELRALYEAESERWKIPARYSFDHLFFSADKRESPRERAQEALVKLNRGEAEDVSGDPFLHGRSFASQSVRDMTFMFGAVFSDDFSTTDPALNEWQGPFPSAYGQHLVKVTAIEPQRQRSFEEVQDKLVQLWREAREREALKNYIAQLRKRYVVAPVGESS